MLRRDGMLLRNMMTSCHLQSGKCKNVIVFPNRTTLEHGFLHDHTITVMLQRDKMLTVSGNNVIKFHAPVQQVSVK